MEEEIQTASTVDKEQLPTVVQEPQGELTLTHIPPYSVCVCVFLLCCSILNIEEGRAGRRRRPCPSQLQLVSRQRSSDISSLCFIFIHSHAPSTLRRLLALWNDVTHLHDTNETCCLLWHFRWNSLPKTLFYGRPFQLYTPPRAIVEPKELLCLSRDTVLRFKEEILYFKKNLLTNLQRQSNAGHDKGCGRLGQFVSCLAGLARLPTFY